MNRLLALTAAALMATSSVAMAGDTPAPDGAKVYFVNIEDGATVSSPVKIIFGLSGMGVAPAGTEKEGTGHHHIFVDRAAFGKGPEGAEEAETSIPADDTHRHFGKGQTEMSLELSSGTHTLQLVLGDAYHIPHNPPIVSDVITVTVK